MLILVLGKDWKANRKWILDKIAQDVAHEQGNRILMVPELISHDTERRLCEAAGDTASRYAEVLSFTRLASRVADSVGHAAPECLDNGGRVVAMASAARQLHSVLKAYAAVETRPEFLTGLVDAVDEFKRCCITSDNLRDAASKTEGSFAQKLEELALLQDAYDGLCKCGKRDPRDQMTWLLGQLKDSSFADDHVFYVDGFPDFTRQHLEILEYLILASPEVVISFNCDRPGSRLMAFEKAGGSALELSNIARRLGVEVRTVVVQPDDNPLSCVAERVFQGNLDLQVLNDQLLVYRTDSVSQECTAAAQRIVDLVQSGVRFREIGVVCSDMSLYRNTVNMVFSRCGIPAYISGTESILDKSVITTVLAAMDTALGGFEQRDVIRYIKSMLSPLDLVACDKLENYAILWSISGSKWLAEWKNHPRGLGESFTEKDIFLLEELNSLRSLCLEPLIHLRDGFRRASNVKQQVKTLYAYLEEISLSERLCAFAEELELRGDNRNAQILNQLWEILLGALEQLYDVLGDTVWDAETFTRLIRLLLSQYDVGTIPPVLDTVTVGPVSVMRCQQVKHLIIMGALEGSMPGYGGSTGVLNDQERTALRKLGVQLTGGSLDGLQNEFSEIYGVFCGAEESITVSCPAGQPSFLFRRLSVLSGGEGAGDYSLGPAMTDVSEACALLARLNAGEAAKDLGLEEAFSEIEKRRNYSWGSVSEENIRGIYGNCLHLSASQIDRHAECRLSYFLRYGMRAKERKPVSIDPAEFGTYVHAVLEKTSKMVMELGGFRKVTLEEILSISKKCSEAYAAERFEQLDTERMLYLFQRNRLELEMIVQELWDELQNSSFEPAEFELSFGDGGKLPAISLPGTLMQALLSGFVDRVDIWNNVDMPYFRVVDYKTGKKDFDYCDVFNGIGLQMLLYMFALEQGEGKYFAGRALPAGVQYFPARAPYVSADGTLSEEEAAELREKIWKRRGLLLKDDAVLRAMENEEGVSRLPYTRKKDGSLSGDLADRDQMKMLKRYVFMLLGRMVDEIASGKVAPNPYTRGSSHNACTFCPYGEICHPETVNDRRNYKAMCAQQFWKDVEREVSQYDG